MSAIRESDQMSPASQREVFRELVSCQDAGMTVEQSRNQMASYFSITVKAVVEVEAMGLEKKWPPLD